MKTGYVNGSDLILVINNKAVGSCTSHKATFNTETKDRAVKPVKTKGIEAGLWKKKGVTGKSISISAEGLCFYDETECGFKDLLDIYNSTQPVTLKLIERENDTKPYLVGNFIITSIEQNAPAQDDVTYSVSFENDGEPTTLDTEGITVNTTLE